MLTILGYTISYMSKTNLNPPDFTKTIGSYSHGISVDIGDSQMIFVTGQIAMDKDGNAVAPDNIVKQTEFVFENILRCCAGDWQYFLKLLGVSDYLL